MTRTNLILFVALVLSSLYLVQVAYDARRYFTELDRAQAQGRRLDIEFGQLRAELQTQATPLRVERAARLQLQMRTASPAVTHYVMLPVAPASEPAAASDAAATGRAQ